MAAGARSTLLKIWRERVIGSRDRDSLLACLGLAAASLWPATDLAAADAGIRTLFNLSSVVWFIGLLSAATGAAWLLARWLGFPRAAALAILFVALFFSYSTFEPALRWILKSAGVSRGAPLLYITLLAVAAVLVWRGTRALSTTRFIPIAAVVICLSTISVALLRATAAPPQSEVITASLVLKTGAGRPNIYHFIFDGMGRPDQLKATHGLELGDVTTAFSARGFATAPNARAVYVRTVPSISSMLSPERTAYIAHVNMPQSDVVRSLRASGYRYHYYGEVFAFAACTGEEDLCLSTRTHGLSEFDIAMLRKTPAYTTLQRRALGATSSRNLARNLAAIAAVPTEEPTFTLSYMTPPHPPFIFSDTCATDQRDESGFQAWRMKRVPRYGVAYRCVAKAALAAVDEIIARDPDAIIIVGGDHGSSFLQPTDTPNWPPVALAERLPVFLAVRAPERCRASISRIVRLPELYPTLFRCLG